MVRPGLNVLTPSARHFVYVPVEVIVLLVKVLALGLDFSLGSLLESAILAAG